jgi:hypothetical protein
MPARYSSHLLIPLSFNPQSALHLTLELENIHMLKYFKRNFQTWKHQLNYFIFQNQLGIEYIKLTQWNRVLEKLIIAQLVKKFLALYGT